MDSELNELNKFLEKNISLEKQCHRELFSLIEAYLSANDVYYYINIAELYV